MSTASAVPAPLEIGISDGIAELRLHRPPVNALNWALKRALLQQLRKIGQDWHVRAVVIASSLPRIFCAGSDLGELAQDHALPGLAWERTSFELELWETLAGLPQPSIAAIEGHALGSGTEMAIACDFRVAGSSASLGLPEVRIGGAPGVQSIARLVSMVGLSAARRILLVGSPLTADQARQIGLVDEVVEAGEAVSRARELAAELAERPSSSIVFLKSALSQAIAPAQQAVRDMQEEKVGALFSSPEMFEGIAAFLEKRDADFRSVSVVKE